MSWADTLKPGVPYDESWSTNLTVTDTNSPTKALEAVINHVAKSEVAMVDVIEYSIDQYADTFEVYLRYTLQRR